ncbi:MAG TPA: STAS domain-containing protein [Thermoleophilaceae bacterium]|nr:STAS domain-containing protein [Thermoleophilaceae bacterium]
MSDFSAHLANGPDGACSLKLRGEFDLAGRPLADEALAGMNGTKKIVLDLSELVFIDSMGIQFVVTAYESAKREGRELTIIRGGTQVDRVFELVGLGDVLPFEDAARP